MVIQEFTAKDTEGRNRVFIQAKCSICAEKYIKQKRFDNISGTCSLRCTNIFKGHTVLLTCDHCNNEFLRAKSKVSRSKSGKNFCARLCKEEAQKYMIDIQPYHYGSGLSAYRDRAFKKYPAVYIDCGFSNKAALEVHHLDGDKDNNAIENLAILCCNCHTIRHR